MVDKCRHFLSQKNPCFGGVTYKRRPTAIVGNLPKLGHKIKKKKVADWLIVYSYTYTYAV